MALYNSISFTFAKASKIGILSVVENAVKLDWYFSPEMGGGINRSARNLTHKRKLKICAEFRLISK